MRGFDISKFLIKHSPGLRGYLPLIKRIYQSSLTQYSDEIKDGMNLELYYQ